MFVEPALENAAKVPEDPTTKICPAAVSPLIEVIAAGIETKGLKYNLENEQLSLGFRSGNSNEALTDGFVSISYKSGELLLMECWD